MMESIKMPCRLTVHSLRLTVREKGQDIYELGKLVGPLIAQTAAYGYFKGTIGL